MSEYPRVIILFGLLVSIHTSLWSQKTVKLASPDGRIVFTVDTRQQQIKYSVSFKNKILIENSKLALVFKEDLGDSKVKTGPITFRDTTETYELVIGKTRRVTARYNEITIPVTYTVSKKIIDVTIRAFNDGVAFRYRINGPSGGSFQLTDELTEFNLSGNPVTHTLMLPGFTTSHEGLYSILPYNKVSQDTLMDMPTLFEYPGHAFVAITEAALINYSGMYLVKRMNSLHGILSPLPKQPSVKVTGTFPHNTPWRVLMIGDKIGTLIESNILTSLAESNKIKDISWIKPGKTTFPWWNGNVLPDTINAPGNNFVTQKYYIDFCARNNIEYHSVVEYGLHQWYVDDGVGFQPGPNSDVTRPVPGLDMKEVCDYAKSVGVGIRVWVHWAALYPKIDSAFAIFERWGIEGMMIDFMDRDDQEMVNIQTEMLEKAAAHKMHVQFHGAYKPTGLHRTYPNEFTREGTLNYESNKWSKAVNPDHDLNIAFVRMLAGPSDYHMGGFRFVNDSSFRVQYTRPLIIGTKCHMLGMYVVLETYLGMVCDYPEAYEGQDGFDFVRHVPTTWDETKVVDARIGNYLAIARRKKNDWYIGVISNNEKHLLDIRLDFLAEGSYSAEIYTDPEDESFDPNKLVKKIQTVSNTSTITLPVAANGGAAIRLVKSH